jgi:DNA-binding NarL/FixJ family response regulator
MIVDDHPVVRHGLAHLIEDDPHLELCAEVAGGEEALRLLDSTRPDVVLVDITLPGISGLELMKRIKSQRPDTKMLVTSMHDEQLYAERALRAGALGYVHKQEALEKVTSAIRQVLRGELYVSPCVAEHMLQRVLRGEEQPEVSPIQRLSDRELEVFHLIGAGMTTRQIAERLHLSPKTVETHRDHIKRKLRFTNNNELVRHAVEWSLQRP